MHALRRPERAAVGQALREMRRGRALSQLELSLRVGMSQRHLSCIETGRAAPSRLMLLSLLDALDVPLAQRNDALLAAGFAPAFAEHPFDAPEMAPVREAIERLLTAHEPAPAMVLDASWNLMAHNRGATALLGWLGADRAALADPTGRINMLRATLRHDGLRALLVDADVICAEIWHRARREAAHHPPLAALLAELAPLAPPPGTGMELRAPMPILTTRLNSSQGVLTFFSTFTTFGAPLEVTTASLRIEHFFPADEATRKVFEQGVR
jgi:transcriptional regulator with XRE-family HTH domain